MRTLFIRILLIICIPISITEAIYNIVKSAYQNCYFKHHIKFHYDVWLRLWSLDYSDKQKEINKHIDELHTRS
jgi:hypothetical protein